MAGCKRPVDLNIKRREHGPIEDGTLRFLKLARPAGGCFRRLGASKKPKKLKRANKSLDARRMARDQESRVGLHRLDWDQRGQAVRSISDLDAEALG
jgi:hypothetical protein